MTKIRAAFTFENALTKVAAHIGWTEVARICDAAESTVRNWSDPDTTASITLDAALKLDRAWHEVTGGDSAPFLTCYAMRFDVESLATGPGRAALLTSVARAAKESGEAVAATLNAAGPTADRADFAIAEREIEESVEALKNSLTALRARRKAVEEGDADFNSSFQERNEGADTTARAPEVAPPPTVTA